MLRWRPTQEEIVFLLAALMFCGFSLLLPGFLAVENLLSLVRSVSILGILGLGMALVVIGRGIDLAMVATMVAQPVTDRVPTHSSLLRCCTQRESRQV